MPLRKNKAIHPRYATPGEALNYLASVCDGATKRDGLGFSRDDVPIGHHLATKAEATWASVDRLHALRLVRIYQAQLTAAGYNPHGLLAGARPPKCSRKELGKLHPGWFPDPTGFAVWRYWNGARWTHHLTDLQHTAAGEFVG